jgi:hypothetical protein
MISRPSEGVDHSVETLPFVHWPRALHTVCVEIPLQLFGFQFKDPSADRLRGRFVIRMAKSTLVTFVLLQEFDRCGTFLLARESEKVLILDEAEGSVIH